MELRDSSSVNAVPRKIYWFIALFTLFIFALTSLGLGYRHLWSDEIETAERGRLILDSGFPRTIDSAGQPSINTGGKEIEEGTLHRYTPWLQFYAAALGIKFGQIFGINKDIAVRLPFVAAHSVGIGLVTYSLISQLGAPVNLAFLVGGALALQSSKIAHSRTARYHALLDLLASIGLLALSLIQRSFKNKNSSRKSFLLLGLVLFLSFHTQTLGGASLASVLFVVAAGLFYFYQKSFQFFVVTVLLPALAGVISLLILSRPWLQGHWGTFSWATPRTFFHPPTLLYAFLFALVWGSFLWKKNYSKMFFLPLLAAVTGIIVISFLDFHPFSQTRYYPATALVVLMWPLYTSLTNAKKYLPFILKSMIAVLLLAELVLGRATGTELFWPFQGLRLIAHDFKMQKQKTLQPLREAFLYISENSQANDPVLIDYVPQMANWYLPGHPIALLPDKKSMTPLNEKNEIWNKPLAFPIWHLWNVRGGSGTWDCSKNCDYSVSDLDLEKGTYTLFSARLQSQQKMCFVKSWMMDPFANAPFSLLSPNAFSNVGEVWGLTVLATVCK